ncbi:hypothetical protein C0991_011309 [Blastosporella zonata]|nr:hypothetical protein C0991_011309 [Blastosporella zonata]
MERYYDVPMANNGTPMLVENEPIYTPNRKRVPRRVGVPDFDIKAALALRHELATYIPRSEVEEIHDIVMSEVEEIQPGCVSIIVGGYRRGKNQSNDVDIVITHPNLRNGGDHVKSLRRRVIQRLYERDLVTHLAHQAGFHAQDSSLRHSLETALTVFILPTKDGKKGLHRRLDLIFAAPEAYWSAVLGWTGSKMFERDLRLWAKEEK